LPLNVRDQPSIAVQGLARHFATSTHDMQFVTDLAGNGTSSIRCQLVVSSPQADTVVPTLFA